MRVLHVTDCFLPSIGGIETQVDDLARRQARAGHDVEVVTATADSPVHADLLRVTRPSSASTGLPASLNYFSGLQRLTVGACDVVHVHLSLFSPLGLKAVIRAVRNGIPVAVTLHSLWDRGTSLLDLARWPARWAEWPVAWSAVSAAAARPVQDRLSGPVRIVPNGVDGPWWAATDHSTIGADVRILTVMRLCRRKRPVPLLRILSAAQALLRHRSDRNLRLTVVGSGPLTTTMARHVRRHDVDGVDMRGPLTRDQIRALMPRHHLYVAPARLESFGIAALEARFAGLPVVGYRGSGVAELVRDGDDGVLVDSDSQLAHRLAGLTMDVASLRALTQQAQQLRPPFGWPITLAGYEDLYEQAIALAGRRSLPTPAGVHVRRGELVS